MGTILKGGILGGLVVFIWGAISWMALPWHKATLQAFEHEALVQESLMASAPRSGVYILPKANHEQMAKGPMAFVVLSRNGSGSMKFLMLRGLATQILAAFLVTGFLLRTDIESYFGRVILAVLFALAAGIVSCLPDWNWLGFPADYTLLEMMDLLIGWFLGGLVISAVVSKKN